MKTKLRKRTKKIRIGSLAIGASSPVLVQSMVIAPPHQTKEAIRQINELVEAGCEIVRIAVPTREDSLFLREIKEAITCPLVADIHYDPLLAIASMEQGVDKIRLNPSNIKDPEMIRKVVRVAKERDIPIRVGANSGSLTRYEDVDDAVDQLEAAIAREIDLLHQYDFDAIVLSAKSSNVFINDAINRLLSDTYPYPIHLGLTEAGTLVPGIVKSTIGLLPLLKEGIGDTIRFSLSGELGAEVEAGITLLKELGIRKGIRLISCPMCGRAHWDVASTAKRILKETRHLPGDLTVAIMGCEVNGPGEAREADIGLAGSGNSIVLFEKGKIITKGNPEDMILELLKRIGGKS